MEKVRFYFKYSVYGKWDITERRNTENEAWRDMYAKASENPNASFIAMTLVRERYTVEEEGAQ